MGEDDTTVRAALPVKRDALYGARDLKEAIKEHQTKRSRVWEEDEEDSNDSDYEDEAPAKARKIDQQNGPRLSSLYREPLELMFKGLFHESKVFAQRQKKWLIINLQSETEFSSAMLNRDTWGNAIVAETIASNFIFWQAYDHTTEGRKVCGYYKLTGSGSLPAVLVLDPFTGEKLRLWKGMVQPEMLLEDLTKYMDVAPKDPYQAPKLPVVRPKIVKVYERKARKMSASVCKTDDVGTLLSKQFGSLELTEEPKVSKEKLCSIRIRLPDGRRVQRSFLRTDPVQLLWLFCSSQLDAAEFPRFALQLAIPGASKTLNYADKVTFEESGLSNSMISVTWDRS